MQPTPFESHLFSCLKLERNQVFLVNSLDINRKLWKEDGVFQQDPKQVMLCCIVSAIEWQRGNLLQSQPVVHQRKGLCLVLLLMKHTPGKKPNKDSVKVFNFLRASVKTHNIQLIPGKNFSLVDNNYIYINFSCQASST